jgi:type IV secretion system protein VirB11
MVGTQEMSQAQEHARRVHEKITRELGTTITSLLKEPDVIEIMLNPDGRLWVERLGKGMEPCGTMPSQQAIGLIGSVASTLNSTVTRENPVLECELPTDGSRFEALIPPVVTGPVFTIRKKATKIFTLAEYVGSSIMTAAQYQAIRRAVENHKNILVVGGTGTGKTTLTNAIIHEMTELFPHERLVIIEDTAELQCKAENFVALRANATVSMLQHLKATLRLRPDRILVGEVRGAEALALLKAWNTGHPGGVATVHANTAAAGLIRMEQLIAEATGAPMHNTIAEAINVVVAIAKTRDGRRVQSVIEVQSHDGQKYLTTNLDQEG